jgi:hypothetical protein
MRGSKRLTIPEREREIIVLKRTLATTAAVFALTVASMAPAYAVKPSQGSTFDTGTCTTTSGHGSNATQTTDNGNCGSADNPNQGGTTGGTNTGHGFVP